jgi:hypothetical protein
MLLYKKNNKMFKKSGTVYTVPTVGWSTSACTVAHYKIDEDDNTVVENSAGITNGIFRNTSLLSHEGKINKSIRPGEWDWTW